MGICYSADHIADDDIHTDITGVVGWCDGAG